MNAKKELERVPDVLKEIIDSQNTSEIEIEIDFDAIGNGRQVRIKGDKTYVIVSQDDNFAKLLIDGDIARDDISSLPKKGLVSVIERFIHGNYIYGDKFASVKQYKDWITGRTGFILKKR